MNDINLLLLWTQSSLTYGFHFSQNKSHCNLIYLKKLFCGKKVLLKKELSKSSIRIFQVLCTANIKQELNQQDCKSKLIPLAFHSNLSFILSLTRIGVLIEQKKVSNKSSSNLKPNNHHRIEILLSSSTESRTIRIPPKTTKALLTTLSMKRPKSNSTAMPFMKTRLTPNS